MAFLGRLHPLLIHFPIALVIAAAAAEVWAIVTGDARWRTVAVGNARAGAVFALMAVLTGWRLASAPGVEMTSLLAWHRWLGSVTAAATLTAALAASRTERRRLFKVSVYRITLLGAGALVALTGHLGGLLVWGADFLRP